MPLSAAGAETKPRAKVGSQRNSKSFLVGWLIAAAILGTVGFEYAVYQHYFRRYIAPYYPVNDDQLETYQWAYNNSLAFKTGSRQETDTKPIALPYRRTSGLNMKGPVVPMLSLAAALIMGPHRFSVGLVNFLYLIVGQIVLFFAIRRRSGMRPALLASGLFLLSGSHYFYAGAINDMRLDYAGMITMGITYLAVLQWLERGKRTDLLLSAVSLFLCATTRSILLIYWIGTALSALTIFIVAASFDQSVALKQFRNRSAFILACLAAVATFYLAMNWHDFASYYITCKTGGEDAMRRRENHVENLAQMLLYYPHSFLEHFQTMLVFAFGAAAASAVGWLAVAKRALTPAPGSSSAVTTGEASPGSKNAATTSPGSKSAVITSQASPDSKSAGTNENGGSPPPRKNPIITPVSVLLIGVVASVLVCVTAYVPSPVVIGVLTMPLCISFALAIEHLMKMSKLRWLPMIVASAIAVCGLCNFNKEFKSPTYIPHGDLRESTMVNHIFDVLIPEVNRSQHRIEILWGLVHGGLNEKAFEIYSWEHLHKPLAVPVDAAYVACYPEFSWSGFERQLVEANFVVAPVELAKPAPNQFEYEGMKSLRENLPKMLATLKTDRFVQIGTYRLHDERPPVIGIFERQPVNSQLR